jgi:hypothetical protein
MLEDSGEGNELRSTTERDTDLPRFGALVRRLHSYSCSTGYIFGSMEYTTMVLPSSQPEEEDKLLSVGTLNDQPSTRAPCATLYSGGQGYNGHMRPGDTNYTPNRAC